MRFLETDNPMRVRVLLGSAWHLARKKTPITMRIGANLEICSPLLWETKEK